MLRAIRRGMYRFGLFDGRTSRADFWYLNLFALLMMLAGAGLDWLIWGLSAGGPIGALATAGMVLPLVCAGARRLQDAGRGAHWLLLTIILPIVGLLGLAAAFCLPGEAGSNQYGEPAGQT